MAGPGLGGVHSETDVVVDFSHDVEFQSFFRTFVWQQNNNDSISEFFCNRQRTQRLASILQLEVASKRSNSSVTQRSSFKPSRYSQFFSNSFGFCFVILNSSVSSPGLERGCTRSNCLRFQPGRSSVVARHWSQRLWANSRICPAVSVSPAQVGPCLPAALFAACSSHCKKWLFFFFSSAPTAKYPRKQTKDIFQAAAARCNLKKWMLGIW